MHATPIKKGFSTSLRFLSVLLTVGTSSFAVSQDQVYDNFDGTSVVTYDSKTGAFDNDFKNPGPDQVNGSPFCAKYIRNAKKQYDYIKIKPNGKLADVTPYASYLGTAPKLKLKVFTNAPVGTLVEIQLGKVSRESYPQAVHSQYQAYTTTSNAWEELEFVYAQTPAGSETSATDVNLITLMFDPNSSSHYTFYFDDLSGPTVVAEVLATQTKKKKENKLWKQREK
jgi:hypothetical protein